MSTDLLGTCPGCGATICLVRRGRGRAERKFWRHRDTARTDHCPVPLTPAPGSLRLPGRTPR